MNENYTWEEFERELEEREQEAREEEARENNILYQNYTSKTDELLKKLDEIVNIFEPTSTEWLLKYLELAPEIEPAIEEGNHIISLDPDTYYDYIQNNYIQTLNDYSAYLEAYYGMQYSFLSYQISKAEDRIDLLISDQEILTQYTEFLQTEPEDPNSFEPQFDKQTIKYHCNLDGILSELPTCLEFAEITNDTVMAEASTYCIETLPTLAAEVLDQLSSLP